MPNPFNTSDRAIEVHSLIFFDVDADIFKPDHNPTTVKNTFDAWHLLPSKKPSFVLPPLKSNYVELMGANGSIDATTVLTGEETYGLREDSLEFMIQDYDAVTEANKTFEALKRQIATYLHGKDKLVALASDPIVFYRGRWVIDDMHTDEYWSVITLKYTLEPYGWYTTRNNAGDLVRTM